MVFRVYVEKRSGFDVEARQLADELRDILGIGGLRFLRIVNRYDVEGIDSELFSRCVPTVFSEPQADVARSEMPEVPPTARVFAVESLPGQFDMRDASASECIQLISQGERPRVRNAKVYVLEGDLTDADVEAVKRYVINPVEAREASLEVRRTLATDYPEPADVEMLDGFLALDDAGLAQMREDMGLAMDQADIAFCQRYFASEGREPTITEIRMIDTYWSDHCRHTTFGTELDDVASDDPKVAAAYERYLGLRHELGRDEKPVCLMDMATIGAKHLVRTGQLKGLDVSEEINACTVRAKVDVDGHDEDWLYLFKNETHNHPTEIEPFGGAATCIGGAIRDPLSGRSYVYQAMRVTGAGDPTRPVSETLEGKLPQRKICLTAAAGYSSYGNQIGLATGEVSELYHPGYVAKRMEIGAVVGAAPASHVRREVPQPGDAIVLLGGRTGRDGIGGATGSSKAHNVESLSKDGAEVQKGNAPTERKLQRLFRREDACRLIKRCNDFGAGGVSVAIGELADGLDINLDLVPKKYDGLDGTELAISESQERMAVALAPEDVDEFLGYASEENLEATVVAHVTEEPRLRMSWRGKTIVDVSREFLSSNGAPKHAKAQVEAPTSWRPSWEGTTLAERLGSLVRDLNVASNKGLSERFDSTIGAATVLMPFGGRTQLTPAMAMAAKLPVEGETTTCSGMAWGFNPYLTSADPYTGAYLAVVESLSRLVAAGFCHEDAYLTFQEYFERLRDEPTRWGKPVAALLGVLDAQVELGVGSIGGKDSMSGSFEDLDVPPTLVSFATAIGNVARVTSPELKGTGHRLIAVVPAYRADGITPEPEALLAAMGYVEGLVGSGAALAVSTPGYGCAAEALFKMCVGNRLGIELEPDYTADSLFAPAYGSFIVELADGAQAPEAPEGVTASALGVSTEAYELVAAGETIGLAELQDAWEGTIEGVYPYRTLEGKGDGNADGADAAVETISCPAADEQRARRASVRIAHPAKPRVLIPVFPGNNCEYDSAHAFERAGAEAKVLVVNNLTPAKVAESCQALVDEIARSQIVMIPGGFSGGDEPDGSAKFITAFFRAPAVTEAVRDLLQARDGLMLGICNGFQALVKLGLVPFGDIRDMGPECPTLTFNSIGRHQSRLVRTRVASNMSPWLSGCEVGDVHTIAISHGEGRFVAPGDVLARMVEAGQVATQYVGENGKPSMSLDVNPNGSVMAIEGITSPDGRVLGKMGHSERSSAGTFKNVPGEHFQPIFEGGVRYFTD
ncbi:MAG: phosphoribosylformylglycinamidine synthase [Atopobiaceae bacterium]|jgi:phosphoribosylformylglycinamidine synthase|nr:phosphoribosylformylglycinamidine synthase [Atopobiaceae bacterium]MCI1389327.1 phosphoribosylformylglycinamidine synthase [Atopobiaceae bacterium]MCI1432390.1 phosphoribosylformylglycinamidine synthase [Atopobiaceae bacterium]MCI1470848.1 phosphoribosylformylglycinamidine synthase [Atopobiaceae bacterium]